MTEAKHTFSDSVHTARRWSQIVRSPDEWEQHALRKIYTRATSMYGNRSQTLGNGQSNALNYRYGDQVLWFDVTPPQEDQPRTVNINGKSILPHRTFTVWEKDGRMYSDVIKNRGIGIVPSLVYTRRLFHAFSSPDLKVDNMVGTKLPTKIKI